MGRIYLMNWEGKYRRWRRMYRGKVYRVSCEELNAPVQTAEGSYRLANEWWKAREAEHRLNHLTPEQELLAHFTPDELRQRIEQALEQANVAQQLLYAMSQKPSPQLPLKKNEIIATVVREDGNTNLPALAHLVGKIEGEPIQLDKTLSHQAERFLALELARGKAALTYADLSAFIHKAMNCPHLPANLDIANIDASTISDFYAWLRSDSGMSPSSQKKCFSMVRRLVRFLWGESLIELPRNLDSRQFTFDTGAKAIKVYPIIQVREMLANLSDRLKLYACLALNCGMLSVDMAMLRHEELQGNRIVRKRTKTKNHENVPLTNYLLWDETLALLNKYPRTHKELVLTSKDGTPLWENGIEDGKSKRLNLIFQQWHRKKLPIPLKALRSISSNLLSQSEKHKEYKDLFLGHSPAKMGERHYYTYSQKGFDKAIKWLLSPALTKTPLCCHGYPRFLDEGV